ncbi:thioredoxin family protein [Prolixibacteraceae bacterium Z1-6]|uniref:Thioredoxin family protein n=1 Tax=Draconibacterium aestuarii TaxID=2998507 RepID=A0A9X3J770_9BACT|nr:thioredoxin family protein [Prolixibacteraceae bacterium Z1-6]
MKSIYFITFVILFTAPLFTFSQASQVYNPGADATADIKKAVELAQKEGKHVFLQIGGNWCPWCIKFHNFVTADSEITTYLKQNFEVVKVNYDQKNRQEELLEKLGFPQRFGFPVFVVLDNNGNRVHTQNSAFLEKDKSYDRETVLRFLKNWSPAAIDAESYKK